MSREEEKEVQELSEIIKKLGEKERAMAFGYVSALQNVDMLEGKQKAAG